MFLASALHVHYRNSAHNHEYLCASRATNHLIKAVPSKSCIIFQTNIFIGDILNLSVMCKDQGPKLIHSLICFLNLIINNLLLKL